MESELHISDGLTRRQLIVRGGVLAGALATGPLWALGAPSQAAAAGGTLSDSRRATYSALVDAVESASQPSFNSSVTTLGTDQFVSYYEYLTDDVEVSVDQILDQLEAAPKAGPFSQLNQATRQAFLAAQSSPNSPAAKNDATASNSALGPIAVGQALGLEPIGLTEDPSNPSYADAVDQQPADETSTPIAGDDGAPLTEDNADAQNDGSSVGSGASSDQSASGNSGN